MHVMKMQRGVEIFNTMYLYIPTGCRSIGMCSEIRAMQPKQHGLTEIRLKNIDP